MKTKSILFISNFLNMHQAPLIRYINKMNYAMTFLECGIMPDERKKMFYSNQFNDINIVKYFELNQTIEEFAGKFDTIIISEIRYLPNISLLSNTKVIFIYSEHIYKSKSVLKNFLRRLKYKFIFSKVKNQNKLFLLCSSSKAKNDYLSVSKIPAKNMFKWGYFPEIIQNQSIEARNVNQPISILWVGRLLKWKNPKHSIIFLNELIKNGIQANLTIIGEGAEESKLKLLCKRLHIDSNVVFKPFIPNNEIQNEMKKSNLFVFSSGKGEGWGAVLNEAMGNGCCCIANIDAGSTRFLMSNEKTGFTYKSLKDLKMLAKQLSFYSHSDILNILKQKGQKASNFIHSYWTPAKAATLLTDTIEKIEKNSLEFNDSEFVPMSNA